jgi:hypothetical protein
VDPQVQVAVGPPLHLPIGPPQLPQGMGMGNLNSIFQVEHIHFLIFQIYPVKCLFSPPKKVTISQALFPFPIFQDFVFQFFKCVKPVKPIFAQGPATGLKYMLAPALPVLGSFLELTCIRLLVGRPFTSTNFYNT